jgi:hypothetical protein
VAQLNFVKFCIVNGIIDYMLKDKIRPQNHS